MIAPTPAAPPAREDPAILDLLREPVCFACASAEEAGRLFLKGVVQDGVNDPALRRDWRRRGGLCARHWAVLRGLENPVLPGAILARDLLGTRLEAASSTRVRPRLCPACATEEETAARALKTLHRRRREVAAALEGAPGLLCVDHLDALPRGPLKTLFGARLEALVAELDEFIRKQDYRFRSEGVGEERDAWLRAIRALGGRV